MVYKETVEAPDGETERTFAGSPELERESNPASLAGRSPGQATRR